MHIRATARTTSAAAAGALLGAALWCAGGAHAAAASARPIHPGATLTVAGNSCEVGFVLAQGHREYLAVPANCTGTDEGTGDSNGNTDYGCAEAQVPADSLATVTGAKHRMKLVYSSFSEMQLRGMHGGPACDNNSLSLFRVDKADLKRVSPRIPDVGRPSHSDHTAPSSGSSLLAFVDNAKMSATAGSSSYQGWRHAVTIDSAVTASNLGAPITTPAGVAVGMLTVLPKTSALPVAGGTSGVSDLRHELRFLRTVHGFHHVHLLEHPLN